MYNYILIIIVGSNVVVKRKNLDDKILNFTKNI